MLWEDVVHTNEGEAEARELADLIPLAYEELRRIARLRMHRLPPGASLTPTDLINEALLRLMNRTERTYNDLDHLIAVAALAMHNVLVDRARRQAAAKRGGEATRVALADDALIAAPAHDMLAFHEACEALRHRSEVHFELVLLRVYAGLTNEEIARRREQSVRTVERQWKFVKAVLQSHMMPDDSSDVVTNS